ncbi:MAG: hypothetical protein OXC37_02670 [Bdellovibrionaceae bacterium]|nr:hypothetical protein [Pseudobdellovibrionaceae bacterium]
MEFHNLDDISGFIIRPSIINNFSTGSWNVGFVSEETLEDQLS